MKRRRPDDATAAFQRAIDNPVQGPYVLRLYVTGVTPRSRRAIASVKRILEERLPGRYELEVVDIYQQPMLARDGQIVAAPTLIKRLPAPVRRLIGDMSSEERILAALDLRTGERQ